MIGQPVRYYARTFASGASLVPTPDVYKRVWDALEDKRLLPSQAFEAPPGAGPRIAFADLNGFQVVFGSDGLIVQQVPASGPFDEFVARARHCLPRGAKLYDAKASRLALIRESLLADAPSDLMGRLLRLPPPFATEAPFEWDWRCAMRLDRTFAGLQEPTNTIATFRRLSGRLPFGPFDGVLLETDINTSADRAVPRFDALQVEAFVEAATVWHDQLAESILGGVHGDPA